VTILDWSPADVSDSEGEYLTVTAFEGSSRGIKVFSCVFIFSYLTELFEIEKEG